MGNLGFLSIDVTTLIGTLLNTLILFLVLKKFLFGKVNAILEERQKYVETTYEEADNAKAEAVALEEEYTRKLQTAKEESAEIVRNATQKANQRSEEIVSAAKTEAAGIITKANEDIEREKKRALNQIKDEISDIAIAVATKVVEKEIDEKDNEKLIEDFIAGVGDL